MIIEWNLLAISFCNCVKPTDDNWSSKFKIKIINEFIPINYLMTQMIICKMLVLFHQRPKTIAIKLKLHILCTLVTFFWVNTLGLIKAVSDTIFDMIVTIYHDKLLTLSRSSLWGSPSFSYFRIEVCSVFHTLMLRLAQSFTPFPSDLCYE